MTDMRSIKYIATNGNTLSEYGVVLGLVALVALGAIAGLGTNIRDLLFDTGDQVGADLSMEAFGLKSYKTASTQGTAPMSGNGLSATGMAVNPQTGMPELTVPENGTGTVSNTTSVNGWENLVKGMKTGPAGTLQSADKAMAMAQKFAADGNPEASEYYNQLATQLYIMSAAGGNLTGNAVIGSKTKNTTGDAARTVVAAQQQIGRLLAQGPPGNVSAADKELGIALAKYGTSLGNDVLAAKVPTGYLDANGQLTDLAKQNGWTESSNADFTYVLDPNRKNADTLRAALASDTLYKTAQGEAGIASKY